MGPRKIPRTLPWLLLLFVIITAYRLWPRPTVDAEPRAAAVVLRGDTMGTTFSVKLVGPEGHQRAELQQVVEGLLEDVNAKMSTYRADSELSRFNQHSSDAPFEVSAETLQVVELSQRVSALTGGAFDITVGRLVSAWGFGPERGRKLPNQEEVAALLGPVGHQHLHVDSRAKTLRKDNPKLYCDLSAVAKGYAVDRVAEALRARGLRDFMVEVGGEVRTSGSSERGSPWRIAVEKPVVGERSIHRVLGLSGQSVATSGGYRNIRWVDGEPRSHFIDPRTGRPVEHALASVSVIHDSCAYADAMATGLSVMGPDAGPELAQREGLSALFIVSDPDGGFRQVTTGGFQELLMTDSPPK